MSCVSGNQIIRLEAAPVSTTCAEVLKIDPGTRVSPVKAANDVCVPAQNLHVGEAEKEADKPDTGNPRPSSQEPQPSREDQPGCISGSALVSCDVFIVFQRITGASWSL